MAKNTTPNPLRLPKVTPLDIIVAAGRKSFVPEGLTRPGKDLERPIQQPRGSKRRFD